METIRKTVESKYAPKQTNVIWVDTSGNEPVEKHFIKGKWREMSGGGGGGGEGLTAEERAAIVALFEMAVYTGNNADEYIEILRTPPVQKTLSSITATVQSPQPTIYTGQSLNDVKQYLTVTATYSDNTTAVIVAADYSLAGSIETAGSQTLTVTYSENGVTKTTTCQIVVTAAPTLYSVTNELLNCTSNGAASVYQGQTYTATMTPNAGYTIDNVIPVVTMGGQEVYHTYNNGVISIPNVSGDIVISINAAAKVLTGITATLNSGAPTFNAGDSVEVVRDYLTVIASYSNASDDTLNSNDYSLALSGGGNTLVGGTNTVIVGYTLHNVSQTDEVSVSTVLAPVFYDKIQFDGDSYVTTNYVPLENFSIRIGVSGDDGTQALGFCYIPSNENNLFEISHNASATQRFFGYSYGSETQITKGLNNQYTEFDLFMTPKYSGYAESYIRTTVGNGTINGTLTIGMSSKAGTNKFTGAIGLVRLYGTEAQNVHNANDFDSYTPVRTFRPCTYGGEAGFWSVETNEFFGNSGTGTLVAINDDNND